MIATRKQIRDNVLNTTNQLDGQIGDLVEDFINVTLQEIGNPAWVFKPPKAYLWSWLKRKTTFTATSEDTVLERDVDKIALLRQLTSPTRIDYVSDDIFYSALPDPTETGDPRIYRLWEIIGTSTKLSAADTLNVISSSSSDTSDYTVVITGYVSGRLQSEVYSMNGTTSVAGSTTFDAREIFISKSGLFNGNVTVSRATGGTSLVVIGKDEISPRFKVVSLWPIPSSQLVYMEYYKRIKELTSDNEMPEIDPKYHHVVRVGTLAKTYQYLNKLNEFLATQELYRNMVLSMVADDSQNPDLLESLKRHDQSSSAGFRLHLSEDVIA